MTTHGPMKWHEWIEGSWAVSATCTSGVLDNVVAQSSCFHSSIDNEKDKTADMCIPSAFLNVTEHELPRKLVLIVLLHADPLQPPC